MSVNNSSLIVLAEETGSAGRAVDLAEETGAPLTEDPEKAAEYPLTLCVNDKGISLAGSQMTLQADFRHMLPRARGNSLNRELLVRAAKIKNAGGPLTAVDATAGFGEDSFLLAAAGFFVDLYEYDPVIAALLGDALKRAAADPELSAITGRMQLHKEDSIHALRSMETPPDIVLLDPMFPERTKKALIKKKFQLLQRLESPCADEPELLDAALSTHPRRIVVKRPAKGPFLAGRKPSYSIKGKTIRYDCIVPPQDRSGS